MPILNGKQQELVQEGLGYPEAPVAMPDGSLLLAEIKNECVTRIGSDGAATKVASIEGGPNGLAIGPDGALYIANDGGFEFIPIPLPNGQVLQIAALEASDYTCGSVQRLDLTTKVCETLYTDCLLGTGPFPAFADLTYPAFATQLRGPDDLVFDDAGGMWVADYGKIRHTDKDITGIYYAQPDGSFIRQMVGGLSNPNGIALSPAQDRLYVSLTFMRMVIYWDLEGPGVLKHNPETLDGVSLLTADLPGQGLLDSIKVDEEGNVYVMTMMQEGARVDVNGGIAVISPEGKMLEFTQIDVPDRVAPMPSNLCWGGPDRMTLYVTCGSSGLLVKMPTSIPGLKPAFT